ncbi:DNA polymerase III, beta subunit [Chloroherpeton thalassium ATCC 35110]|uniref:Beta sliding clamp n=1 Tax=Chloroherpeton thalassium (strain ATCC 35110 / GB-78) TaxID=517418 RepID=B3QWU6_CHLT3|nr:DNA polymerase III subunit beta [Chloroherpeton thalassium]ACF13310.1 DNA polymerase III, beta subunit [Chloroherpeton thalassium ATCC 35110]
MKFSSSIKHLSEAVNNTVLALPAKATDARYESINLKLEQNKLSLFATDGDISLTLQTNVESSDSGAASLNAKKFQDVLRNMYDAIAEFSVTEKESAEQLSFLIKTDRGSYVISAQAGFEEESAGSLQFDLNFPISREHLAGLIDKTIFAASTDGMRPAMMGVLFEIEAETIRAVSTDGHRLVKITRNHNTGAEGKLKIIVPSRVLGIVRKLFSEDGDVEISIDANSQRIRFRMGETILLCSLVSENYPNYEAVIPLENDKTMLLNRSNLLGSVKRVGRFSSRGDVRFHVQENSLAVSAENADEGASADESVPCEYKDEAILIGFNSKFIEDALQHLNAEEVIFQFSSPTRAAIILPKQEEDANEDVLMLVMPVRINV